ncbi:MAG: hypothetical protein ABEJ85_05470 [Haloarculaceae archaeon]
MDRWRRGAVFRVTVVLLTAGFALIGLGAAGIESSLPVVIGLLVAAGCLHGLARLLEGTAVERVDDARLHADLWLGPVVGAAVALVWLDATAGELQALGGIVGLVGMVNYFLRPVFHLVWLVGQRVATRL